MEFLSTVIFRAPLLPFTTDFDKKEIMHLLDRETVFSNGVRLASPSLFANCQSEKAYYSLGRYYIRCKTRPTPFGLFSGTGTATWSHETSIILKSNRKAHVQLDIQFARRLQKDLEKRRDPNLLYYPNTSLYKAGKELRCMSIGEVPTLVSIFTTKEIEKLITQTLSGYTLENCTQKQQNLFEELVSHQVIKSALETPCTSDHPYHFLLQYIASYPEELPWKNLNFLLKRLQKRISLSTLNAFENILPALEKTPLHITQTCPTLRDRNLVNREIQEKIKTALPILQQWSPPYVNAALEEFIRRFQERYADEEIPLTEVFDPEYGIEYIPSSSPSDLTEGFPISSPVNVYANESHLQKELSNLLLENQYTLELPQRSVTTPHFNASFSIVFRLVQNGKIYLEMAGGSSATSLLGRFGNYSQTIKRLLHTIVAEETRWNPDVDFAEVLNLPEGKAGNVVLRPSLRNYEIPYLGTSNRPRKDKININDLLVSVVHSKVVLRNRLTGRRIIPRIANAHNFRLSPLPLYRFLGDLQFQESPPSLYFSWGQLDRTFLPRVCIGDLILHPASWSFRTVDFHFVKLGTLPHCKHPLPQYFIWKNGDQELWVDRENEFSLSCFKDAVQMLDVVRVFEFFFPDKHAIKSASGEAFCHQFIASVIQKRPLFTDQQNILSNFPCRRDFYPGSEWIYLKYYCARKGRDRILRELIAPLVQNTTRLGWIDKWFFVRYYDPDPHIRLRLHVSRPTFLQDVLHLSDKHSLPFLEERSVWKVQIDTYKREVERYHPKNIEIVESLFFWDSLHILQRIKKMDVDNWYWCLQQIKIYLHAAEFNLAQKRQFVSQMSASLGMEFCSEKKIHIDQKYRAKRKQIEEWLNKSSQVPKTLCTYLEAIKKNTPTKFPEILGSLIHMMVNRCIESEPRMHEYLMYEFLVRYYKSYAARNPNVA